PDLLAGVGEDYAFRFLTEVTGTDARAAYEEARRSVGQPLRAGAGLPHRLSTALYSIVQQEAPNVGPLKDVLKALSESEATSFRPKLEELLSNVDFFRTPFGKWLEAAATSSLLTAITDDGRYQELQVLARR